MDFMGVPRAACEPESITADNRQRQRANTSIETVSAPDNGESRDG
jgi:hypothetical protein